MLINSTVAKKAETEEVMATCQSIRAKPRYFIDPKEVYRKDFPGETFRVLKEKEIKQFGEYRTRRLVLEAWDKMEG